MVFACQVNATVFVKKGSSGDGTSWESAYGTLTEALQSATANAEIWVAKGTYHPTQSTDRNASFEFTKDIKVYGGFAGFEHTLSQRNPSNYKTILSGEIGAPGIADNAYNVIYIANSSKNLIIDGFTITAGNANGEGPAATRIRCGGAIYINGSNGVAKPSISNCIFINNKGRDGAAIYNNGQKGESSPTFTNCTFQDNEAGLDGGALFNDGRQNGASNPVLKNCQFVRNMGTYGGAIFNATETGVCNLYMENCAFEENSAYLRGGAVFNLNGSDKCVLDLLDCTFTGNYPDDQSKVFTNNTARSEAYAINRP